MKAFGLHKEHKAYKKCEMGVSTAAQGKREEVVHKKGKSTKRKEQTKEHQPSRSPAQQLMYKGMMSVLLPPPHPRAAETKTTTINSVIAAAAEGSI